MNDDVRRVIYGTIIIFVLGVLSWIGFLYLNACSFTFTCNRAAFPIQRTSVPTLIPATLPVNNTSSQSAVDSSLDQCRVKAVDLIGAWVSAGAPETGSFQFVDTGGRNCESTFDEIRPLFVEGNLWYSGSISCISCHSVDVSVSPAQLDLSSYAGIIAGSHRADVDSAGTDILGGGDWNSSTLYQFISAAHAELPGHDIIKTDLMVFAGKPLPPPPAAPTSTPEPVVTPTP